MSSPDYDAVIVGSGAGGAAAAFRLVRAGWRVALIEKGPRLPKDGSTLDVDRVIRRGEFLSREVWIDPDGREFKPEEHFNVGGKTKWYGAALLRFAPQEFLPDIAHGCSGWPLSYTDLEPYYAEAEGLLGVRRFDVEPDLQRLGKRLTRGASRWSASPLPLALSPAILHDPVEAAHFDGFASARALKQEAEQSLLARVLGDPRLTLLTSTEIVDLVGDPSDSRVVRGVRTADGHTIAGRTILLGSGALHSPRLLQRYLRRTNLSTALPIAAHVGANLKMHLLTAAVAVSWRRHTDLIRKTLVLLNSDYPHSSVQPLGFDAELIANLMPQWLPRVIAAPVARRAYGFFLQTEDGSDPRNRVDEPSTGSSPVLDYRAERLPAAESEHRRFTRALQRRLLQAGYVTATQRIGLSGTAHVCGTLAAGTDNSHSVVNADGAVHGMSGLYVVDGSVLPRSSRVNPSLTIYAWALRVSDRLTRSSHKDSLQCQRTFASLLAS